MLNGFDWIRRSRTGAELLATLRQLAEEPDLLSSAEKIGSPHSALNSPCQRCWLYPRIPYSEQKVSIPELNLKDEYYCEFCKAIVSKARKLGLTSYRSMVIWSFVNRLPRQLQNGLGAYIHDENRFLLMTLQRELKTWLQQLVLYNGTDLKGLIQIFPPIGSSKRRLSMGDILCRAIHHEANFPMDQLRIRFYTNSYQLLKPHIRDGQGILTFEVSEFLNLMETVMIFRALLRPEEQKMLLEITTINNAVEEQFYWGRFQGYLSQEAKDMLDAWRIRHWPKNRIKLLYELTDYVALPKSH